MWQWEEIQEMLWCAEVTPNPLFQRTCLRQAAELKRYTDRIQYAMNANGVEPL